MTSEQPPISRVQKRRRSRWIVPALVVAVVLLISGGTAWALLRPKIATVGAGETTVLTAGTLTDGISATGTVSAATSANVYSSLKDAVTQVDAELGQRVSAGDTLAQIDTATVDKQIASKKASMTQSQATAAAALAAAQHKSDAAAGSLRSGTNSAVVTAESSVSTAYNNWLKATKTYEDYKSALGDEQNAQLVSAETALDSAEANVTNAGYSEKKARDAWELALKPAYPDATKVTLDEAVNALDAARSAYRNAQDAYDAAATGADTTLSDYQAAADQAHDAWTNAQKGLTAAQSAAQTELQSSQDAVKSSQASSRQDAAVADLAGLLADRASATVTAPIDGTVTAVNAVEGAPATGVLFVIETKDRLTIASSVNEYDVNTVKPGMQVLIRSDATRDAVHQGTLTSVAPTSAKDAEGKSITGSDIQYATTIDVTSTGTGLRIGMNTRLQYIVAEQKNVLSVPSDAVSTTAEGATAVLVLAERPDGRYTVQEVPVAVGLKTDVDVGISGTGVQEGLRVLNSPTTYRPGTVVSLTGL